MSEKNVIKIVIDTNVWISFLIGKKIISLKNAIVNNDIEICVSHELLEEFTDVCRRPNFQKYFAEKDVSDLLVLFENKFRTVRPSCKINECRDAKDNFLLELAVSARADYLVTGDQDLLTLNPFRGIEIINPAVFEDVLKKGE